jgi:hypothetical protein
MTILKMKSGRGAQIRTEDLRFPKPTRYQAALRPDTALIRGRGALAKGLSTPGPRNQSSQGQTGPAPAKDGWRASAP